MQQHALLNEAGQDVSSAEREMICFPPTPRIVCFRKSRRHVCKKKAWARHTEIRHKATFIFVQMCGRRPDFATVCASSVRVHAIVRNEQFSKRPASWPALLCGYAKLGLLGLPALPRLPTDLPSSPAVEKFVIALGVRRGLTLMPGKQSFQGCADFAEFGSQIANRRRA